MMQEAQKYQRIHTKEKMFDSTNNWLSISLVLFTILLWRLLQWLWYLLHTFVLLVPADQISGSPRAMFIVRHFRRRDIKTINNIDSILIVK